MAIQNKTLDTAVVESSRKSNSSTHLGFLDGIRGLAAIYVAFFHAMLFTGKQDIVFPPSMAPLTWVLSYGHYSVAVFIVLSGFCLMLPVAQSADGNLRGGLLSYFQRRARRILPPYYIALLLFIALIALVPVMQQPSGTVWDNKIPVDTQAIASHLLLVHNLSSTLSIRIDGPMWSVATEWQIYFIFPFVLLPLRRRWGIFAAVIGAVILGLAPHFLHVAVHRVPSFDSAHFWYIGLFAFGMAAAEIAFSNHIRIVQLRERIRWREIMMASCLLAAIALVPLGSRVETKPYLAESIVGLAVASVLLNWALRAKRNEPASLLVRICESRLAISAGVASYSFYLIHSPLLGLINLITLSTPMSSGVRLLMMLLIAVPLALSVSLLFHVLVERRFLPGHIRKVVADSRGAVAPR